MLGTLYLVLHNRLLTYELKYGADDPEYGGLQSMGSRRVGHDCVAFTRSLRPQAGG